MISDSQARRIALFFLLVYMDEKAALQAAHKAAAHLKAMSSAKIGEIADRELIRVLRRSLEQNKNLFSNSRSSVLPEEWILPRGLDIESWAKFQRDSSQTEVVAVVFSKVLSFSDEAIAYGLNISVGAVRYRVGKGIRQLGAYVQKSQRAGA